MIEHTEDSGPIELGGYVPGDGMYELGDTSHKRSSTEPSLFLPSLGDLLGLVEADLEYSVYVPVRELADKDYPFSKITRILKRHPEISRRTNGRRTDIHLVDWFLFRLQDGKPPRLNEAGEGPPDELSGWLDKTAVVVDDMLARERRRQEIDRERGRPGPDQT
jgi:hypothetical protein